MAYYMQIKDIKGDVKAHDFVGAIAIFGLVHIAERPIFTRPGSINRELGLMNIGYLQLYKHTDSASAELFSAFLTGSYFNQVEIYQCRSGSGNPEWATKITLSNVFISEMHEHGNVMGTSETLTLAYSKIEKSYRTKAANGQWQVPKRTGFDIPTAVVT